MSKTYAITTIDNPYHPLDQFDEWFRYDCLLGYNTLAYVDRVGNFSNGLTEDENQQQLSSAIDEIIKFDAFGIYYKIVVEDNDEE